MSYGTFPIIGDISIYQTSLFAGTWVISLQVFGPANLKSCNKFIPSSLDTQLFLSLLNCFIAYIFINSVAFGLVLEYSGKKLLEGSEKWDF